jgi:PQQ-like domain/HEAT repeats
MAPRHPALLLALSLALAWAGRAAAADPDPVEQDERTLKEARLPTDGPGLLDFFRKRTLGDKDRARIEQLIAQLGADEFSARERASAELVALGGAAAPLLRQAVKSPDIEVVRRAERCLQMIEQGSGVSLTAAAARVLGARKPPGAAEVLLNYAPLADDDTTADAVRSALAAVAVLGGQPDQAVAAALEDKAPARRAAAVQALVRSGTAEQRRDLHKYLQDPDATVRLQAALAFFDAKDKEAVPVLINLLGELPAGQLWRAEELLCRVAGDKAPAVSLGKDEAERKKCRDAWAGWWAKNGGAIDLAKIDLGQRLLGYTLLVELTRGVNGRVVELGSDGQPRWQIELTYPVDAQVVGNDRVLVAEYRNRRVTERNFKGEVIWEKMATGFVHAAQRLANGNTLIVARNQLVEVDRDGKEVATFSRPNNDIQAAQRLRDGQTVFLTVAGQLVRLDDKNNEVKTFAAGTTNSLGTNIEALPNGRILVPQQGQGRVVEFDLDGKVVWEAAVQNPTSVARLPNGNTLVGSLQTQRVVELDRTGREVWEHKSEGRLLRVRRR